VYQKLLFRNRNYSAIRALVVLHSRELAVKCRHVMEIYAQFTDIRSALVIGGVSDRKQEAELGTFPDVVFATPGKMTNHLRNAKFVGIDELEILVLDEADRLLQVWTEEVEEIVRHCPKGRQTLLFSATKTEKVDELIKLSLNHPLRISLGSRRECVL